MHWITANLYELLPALWASIVLVFTALICGGLVGVEFEHRQKSVGIHTLTLVCFGSTVFTMVTAVLGYRTPIAAQIVSGIGFLGAGVILRGPYGISGLTSAATVWAVAAIGMVVGVGYAGAAVALSLFVLGTMALLSFWERRFVDANQLSWATIIFRTNGGKTLLIIREALEEYGFARDSYSLGTVSPGVTETSSASPSSRAQMRLRYSDSRRRHRQFLSYLASLDEVEEVDCELRSQKG